MGSYQCQRVIFQDNPGGGWRRTSDPTPGGILCVFDPWGRCWKRQRMSDCRVSRGSRDGGPRSSASFPFSPTQQSDQLKTSSTFGNFLESSFVRGKMADGGDFDPCECVWSHELATRRLINLIRQNQDYCTENECFTDASQSGDQTTAVFFIGFWFLMAMVLFFLRPRSSVPTEKNHDQFGPNYDPPAPPPTS